tara:strand:- start:485 stop:709 length:225 start_codon:yes stop_codon:yes gene_type:complete
MEEIIAYIICSIIILALGGAWIGMWLSNSDPMTDHQLYGMDGEEYTKKMMGEEEYNKLIEGKQKYRDERGRKNL